MEFETLAGLAKAVKHFDAGKRERLAVLALATVHAGVFNNRG